MAGVPVYSQAGRGGGWSLVGGARTDLSGLTAAEARALFLVAGPGAATPEVKAALRKLVRALPETFRASAESAGGAVIIDASDWDRLPVEPPAHLAALQQAVVDGVQVRLDYAGRDREPGERTRPPPRPRGQTPDVVPDRRHRRRDAHVPGEPGAGRRAHRSTGATARGLRPGRDVADGAVRRSTIVARPAGSSALAEPTIIGVLRACWHEMRGRNPATTEGHRRGAGDWPSWRPSGFADHSGRDRRPCASSPTGLAARPSLRTGRSTIRCSPPLPMDRSGPRPNDGAWRAGSCCTRRVRLHRAQPICG